MYVASHRRTIGNDQHVPVGGAGSAGSTLDPVERRLRNRPRRSRTSAGSPSVGCLAACSTTSTAAPRTSARSPATCRAFAGYEFEPRILRDVSRLDTSTTILGRPAAMPLIIAPTGFTRIAHSQGELAVAGQPHAPAFRGRCRRWGRARSRRSQRSATATSGSRCTPGATDALLTELLARARGRRLHGGVADGRHRRARSSRA